MTRGCKRSDPDDVKEKATSLLNAENCLQLDSKSRSLDKQYEAVNLTFRCGMMMYDVV